MELRQLYGQVRELPQNVEESRTVKFILSTPTRDRHRTILNQNNWKLDNFNRNPIVGYQHNVYGDPCREPNPDDVLGSARAWIEEGVLLGEVTFETKDVNPLAEKIFRKVLNGTLRAVSVGFLPVGEGKYGEGEEAPGQRNETYYFEGQELVEFSIVNIPSNPDAIRKSFRDQTSHAIMYVKKHLGDDVSFSEIESMSVKDILERLKTKKDQPEMSNKKSILDTLKGIVRDLSGGSEEPAKRVTATTADGTLMDIDKEDGEPAVGDTVSVGGTPATGSFLMPDGSTIVCVDGKITEITPVKEEAPEPNLKEENARLLKANQDLEARLLAMEAEHKEFEDSVTKEIEVLKKSYKAIGSNYDPNEKNPRQGVFNNGKGEQKEEQVNRFKALKEKQENKQNQ
jgi:hypothetical protein